MATPSDFEVPPDRPHFAVWTRRLPRAVIAPETSLWFNLEVTATQSNRHGNVDYTPYEGMTFIGGPAAVYVRGELAYRNGEVLAEPGSGRFVHRTFAQPAPGPAVR